MESNFNPAIQKLEEELSALLTKVDGLKYAIATLGGGERATPAATPPTSSLAKAVVAASQNIANMFKNTLEKQEFVYNTIVNGGVFVKIKSLMDASNGTLTYEEVRAIITSLKNDRKIVSIQPTTSLVDTYWGLPNWIDNELPKKDHLFDKSTLVGKSLKDEYRLF